MLDFAVLISNQEDLRNFLENICDFDMRVKIERTDTKWFLVTVINIIFFVSLLPDIPIDGGVKLSSYIINNKGLHALVKNHNNREYVDNLCLFRCMALFDGASLDCERAANEKFYKNCHEREFNPNKFPGVTLRELVDVEDIFQINVAVYSLEVDHQSPKAWIGNLRPAKQNHPARSPFANCSNFMARHVVLYFIKLPFSQHLVLHTYEKPNCTIIVLYVAFCGFVMNRENQELF